MTFLINFLCWKMCRWLMYGNNCKLTHWACWLYYMQFPLDNRENKNLQNVCLSQIQENIFWWKFLLIQYTKYSLPKICKPDSVQNQGHNQKGGIGWRAQSSKSEAPSLSYHLNEMALGLCFVSLRLIRSAIFEATFNLVTRVGVP